jgi:hypothetical protein
MVQVDDGFKGSEVPMTKVAIGNIIPDPKIVEKIRAETEAKNRVPVQADKLSWTRSKNKAFRRKMAKQRGEGNSSFMHEKKKGR